MEVYHKGCLLYALWPVKVEAHVVLCVLCTTKSNFKAFFAIRVLFINRNMSTPGMSYNVSCNINNYFINIGVNDIIL